MKKYLHIISPIIVLITITSCDVRYYTGERSGTSSNDYVEEPIKKDSIKYENALKVSNAVIDNIIKGNYVEIEKNYIHKDMKSILTAEAFKNLISGAVNALGPIKKYKKMQWGFVPAEENGKKLLFSFKIIEHEKGMLNYSFVFDEDNKYEKLMGIQINIRKGARVESELK